MSVVARSRIFKAGVIAAVTVVLLGLGYLGMKQSSPTPATIVEKLAIAVSSSHHNGLPHIAAAMGFFTEQDLDVTLVPIPYGKAGIERVLEGKADLTFAAEVPFSVAVIKGEALSLVATMLDISDSHGVIARRDRGISSVADLVGKKVGLKLGTSAEYFLWALLVRHRIAPDSVILVDLPPGQLAQALAEGSIDAVAVWQPYVLDTQNAVGENAVSFVDIDVYTQSSVLVARSDILKQRSVAIERLMRALLKAEQLSRSQPEESLKVVATWLKRDVEDLRPLWKALDFNISLQQSHLITLEDEARWAMNSGYVAKGPIHNFLPNLYLDALLAVKPERVTVVR